MPEHLPWPRLQEIAYGILGLTPAIFWSMTPCEFLCALRGFKEWHHLDENGAITREELDALRAAFPDV